ncbi:MAG: filamentous hemagglutinin N-terminal domain-containing protein [Deltaproteobacteria bacterium]|nr:filamentous hemagglutinin N-terminal domain-containing protein [Deltaproteobacteria bacterium]
MLHKTVAAILSATLVVLPAITHAGPQIPGFHGTVTVAPAANALPVLKAIQQGVSAVTEDAANSKLTVYQDQSKAVIDWESFNIGQKAWTHFDQQKNKDWAVLNRIHDKSPSQIRGKLSADGKVYLINQNGILFGPESQTNVHTLVASSLNMTNGDFLEGLTRFKAEDYLGGTGTPPENGLVSNEGKIQTDELGNVFLIGGDVVNSGAVSAPAGQIGLAAGSEVDIYADPTPDSTRTAKIVNVRQAAGDVFNTVGGQLTADTGMVGMYGRVVNQEGMVRSVTAIKKNGQIELHASEKILTGANSVTAAPISDSTETAHESFTFHGGSIQLRGLDPNNPLNPEKQVKHIEHRGLIEAPAGNVGLQAEERVYLESGSRIDAGGVWVDKSASSCSLEGQLNSVNLRDEYGQKDGILKGATIHFDSQYGSAIGDISGYLQSQELSAAERSTKGGEILIAAVQGDLIVKEGASIVFSGGGVRYGRGTVETSKLLCGGKVYDIGSAPGYLLYDKIMGSQRRLYRKYGVVEEYNGLYYGGNSPIKDLKHEFVEGADAGQLKLMARHVVLDGTLDGSVTRGFFQTDPSDPTDEYGKQSARGWKEPKGGTLIIGDIPLFFYESAQLQDLVTDSVLVTSGGVPSFIGGFEDNPYSKDQPSLTQLNADTLNSAGLSRLEIYANNGITIDEGTHIQLAAGGNFTASSRAITHRGVIEVPAGVVNLNLTDNITAFEKIAGPDGTPQENPRYVQMESRLYVETGAAVIAAGEHVENAYAGKSPGRSIQSGHRDGGSISLADYTMDGEGVFLKEGSLCDVSGGYEITPQGKVSGGKGGTLSILGNTLALDGDLKGHAITGSEGGAIILHAAEVIVSREGSSLPEGFGQDSPIPSNMEGRLLLHEDRLASSGFSHIELRSTEDLTVEADTFLTPSQEKLATPMPVDETGAASPVTNHLAEAGDSKLAGTQPYNADPLWSGGSSIKASAGVHFIERQEVPPNQTAVLNIAPGATLKTAPGGEISLSGPTVEVGGRLEALSGKIGLTAKFNDLVIQDTGQLVARGYVKPVSKSLMNGFPTGYNALPGGSVSLSASLGDLILESGSSIDVSGSQSATAMVLTASGIPAEAAMAGKPGSVSLAFGKDLTLDGELFALSHLDGLDGGTLTIVSKGTEKDLALDSLPLNSFQEHGFDAFTFGSAKGIRMEEGVSFSAQRSLTLDAPRIVGGEDAFVELDAPWVRLVNASLFGNPAPQKGSGQLSVSADWLEVDGALSFSGFNSVTLASRGDLILQDHFYSNDNVWKGNLSAPEDITLQADRIYPSTLSRFTVECGGTLTTLAGDGGTDLPVMSAGASLTLRANRIHHTGFVAAPLGEISLEGTGVDSRVFLAPGSSLTTVAKEYLNFGALQDIFWTREDKSTRSAVNVEDAPKKSLLLKASEVIVKEGAVIDLSGGGGVFGYQWLAGIEGSQNPLTKKGRYVIIPQGTFSYPGPALYIAGGGSIAAGFYSILPVEYAFLPGAVILTDLGMNTAPGMDFVSSEGHDVIAGYATLMGSAYHSDTYRAYSVRPASEVLKEGHFEFQEFTAGDGGSITFQAATTIADGIIRAQALEGFDGGSLSLSGTIVTVASSGAALSSGIEIDTPIPSQLAGRLQVDASGISGKGFKNLTLGDRSITESVAVESGSLLQAEEITLAASREISIQSGAGIEATGDEGNGVLNLLSPAGSVTVMEGASIHASDSLLVDARNLTFEGDLQVDRSKVTLKSDRILFTKEDASQGTGGLAITPHLWSRLSVIDNIELFSRSDLFFSGDFSLNISGSLTIDAARIAGSDEKGDGSAAVSLSASTVHLLNAGSGSSASILPDGGTFTVAADGIAFGKGSLRFDGFGAVHLLAQDDVVFQGTGSMTAQGDVHLAAARIGTALYAESVPRGTKGSEGFVDGIEYSPVNFTIDAGSGSLTLSGTGGTSAGSSTPGGMLQFSARTIDHSAFLDAPSATVLFTATGTGPDDGIFLRAGSRILSGGSTYGPGGRVALVAQSGTLVLEAGSLIDVSAGAQGDAGSILLNAPSTEILLAGELLGGSRGGLEGSFTLDTLRLGNLDNLALKLAAGGFGETLEIRSRSGDLVLSHDQTLKAAHVTLTADGGSIDISGTINASREGKGGVIELFAGFDCNLNDGSLLAARGTGGGAQGGSVFMGADAGSLYMASSSLLDVSGADSENGGSVHFRARQTADDVRMDIGGTVTGASQILAEAFRVYAFTGNKTIGTSDLNTWKTNTQNYMNVSGAVQSRLLTRLNLENTLPESFHFVPGIEVKAAGDLTLGTNWDLTTWRYGDEPGFLTLRAGGNLNVNNDLVDHPTAMSSLVTLPGMDSWGYTLSAGSDLASPSPLAVTAGSGDLKIADGKVVYTESGPLAFASGRDVLLNPGKPAGFMIANDIRYSLATYDGSITGKAGRNLQIRGGAIQSATGDVDIQIGGDLTLQTAKDFGSGSSFTSLGSIRTTGESPTGSLNRFWEYSGGGSIHLDVWGAVSGNLAANAWDFAYGTRPPRKWSASYDRANATEGLATMAGGDLTVRSGGDFFSQAGTFGKGDLTIVSGGNLGGRFLVKEGSADLHASGSFGTSKAPQVIEAFDAKISVTAQGNIELGTIVNPTVARNQFANTQWNLGYTPDSSAFLHAVSGDVFLYGDSPFYDLKGVSSALERILPPTLEIVAGRDIRLQKDLALVPSPSGNLSLTAGRDIDGAYRAVDGIQTRTRWATLILSDMEPSEVYGPQSFAGRSNFYTQLFSRDEHADHPVHQEDPTSVQVSAGGDIRNLQLFLAKSAVISAVGNVENIFYKGQNVHPWDTTCIQARGDIFFGSLLGTDFLAGIEHGGPGRLIVQAGGSIDLGASRGIQTYGNSFNGGLPLKGSDIIVAAGFDMTLDLVTVEAFFNALREAGTEYSDLLAAGDKEGAAARIARVREEVITPFLGESRKEEAGVIDMVTSQISTMSDRDNIFLLTGGDINVGKSTFFESETQRRNTGIFTAGGGASTSFPSRTST